MNSPLRIGLAGLGTVGGGTLALLEENAAQIAERCGRELRVTAVSARTASKARGYRFVADAAELAADPEVDVVVEVIGGSENVARQLVERALSKGKSVVTANKALIAHHGLLLAQLAEKNHATLAFEAAVAGGIPIIKSMRDGLAANRFRRIVGILNGTCNYILWNRRADFGDILAEAQALGYAEAEPSFDIDGIDTAHKITLLASLAFGCAPAIQQVEIEGIRRVSLRDLEFAAELGYRIKLLGIAELGAHGLMQRVSPCMVPTGSPLANVHDVFNAVAVEGHAVGHVFFEGRGAGAGPTASSIVADLMDIARGTAYKPFTLPVAKLANLPNVPADQQKSAHYVRLNVLDKPGVLADITGLFRDSGISVRAVMQHSHAPGEPVDVVLTTHETTEAAMVQALARVALLPSMHETPYRIRIESL